MPEARPSVAGLQIVVPHEIRPTHLNLDCAGFILRLLRRT